MDPKRKRLYIILIVSCLILSAVVILWGSGINTSSPSAPALTSNPTSAMPQTDVSATAVRGGSASYPAPQVFPANKTFDTSVLDSSSFKVLQPFEPVQINPSDLGRDDPFKNY